ncbi:MAG: 6-phosphogluconolactonase [Lentisphaerae bacterium]|nr:6-phosphogluconolactonase [Lentisphaerota bacterium]
MVTFREFGSRRDLEDHAVELLAEAIGEASGVPRAIMLTGGKTPLAVYARLTRQRPAADGLHLMISDERHVPESSPDHNAAKIRPLAEALGLPPERFLCVETRHELDDAARRYDAALQSFLQRGRISLGILGLGADGHLASLFTDEDVQRGAGQLAVAVRRALPPHRVSVTPALLCLVERLVFWVAGADKSDVVRQWRDRPDAIVAGRVVKDLPHVECWSCV